MNSLHVCSEAMLIWRKPVSNYPFCSLLTPVCEVLGLGDGVLGTVWSVSCPPWCKWMDGEGWWSPLPALHPHHPHCCYLEEHIYLCAVLTSSVVMFFSEHLLASWRGVIGRRGVRWQTISQVHNESTHKEFWQMNHLHGQSKIFVFGAVLLWGKWKYKFPSKV